VTIVMDDTVSVTELECTYTFAVLQHMPKERCRFVEFHSTMRVSLLSFRGKDSMLRSSLSSLNSPNKQ
jgi:hypothetical protein